MYGKLFSSITDSSLWTRPSDTCKLFMTMIAMANRGGCVYASRSGLARRAVLVDATLQPDARFEAAIADLESPDAESGDRERAPENEGRRIRPIAGGWLILNYSYYRELRDEDERRDADAERKRKSRMSQKAVTERDGEDASALSRKSAIRGEERRGDHRRGEHTNLARAPEAPAAPAEPPPPDPWPTIAPAEAIEAAARLRVKLDVSPLRTKPTDQILVALVTEYGEDLIVETITDCWTELTGKPWKYLEAILTRRRDNSAERPRERRKGVMPSDPKLSQGGSNGMSGTGHPAVVAEDRPETDQEAEARIWLEAEGARRHALLPGLRGCPSSRADPAGWEAWQRHYVEVFGYSEREWREYEDWACCSPGFSYVRGTIEDWRKVPSDRAVRSASSES